MDKPLSWSESYTVGHEALDAEHRRLIKAINDVCAACDARQPAKSIYALLEVVERETVTHLRHEDKVMHDIFGDTARKVHGEVKGMTQRAIDGHLAEHERNLKDLRAIMRTARAETDCGAAHICDELKHWFFDHAVKYDSQLKAIFQAM